MLADEQIAALGAFERAGVVAVVGEEVVEVEVDHLVDFADHLGAEVVAEQVVDQTGGASVFRSTVRETRRGCAPRPARAGSSRAGIRPPEWACRARRGG